MRRKKIGILLTVCVLGLCACGGAAGQESGDGTPGQSGVGKEPVTLTLASFGGSSGLAEQVEQYNREHEDFRIVIEQYQRSDIPEEDGIARMQREIMTGKGPDLIDFGADFAASDILGGYTEDLDPFLEAEREKSGAEYFDNILELFRYNGKLPVLPVAFTMRTFAGSRAVLGDRESWNIRELMECYENRAEGVILYPGEMKKDVFGTLMNGNLDYYIDWEAGTCRFEGEEFARVLAFAGRFPDTLQIGEDYSVKRTFLEGRALLCPLRLNEIYDICRADYIFGDDNLCYIGFPVEQGQGTVVAPSGTMLAISSGSGHKEAAWEFLAGFLREEYQSQIKWGFPVCRGALEERLLENREVEYAEDSEGNLTPVAKARLQFEGEEPVEIYCITEAQADRLLHLIEAADLCSAGDQGLYKILLEEAEGYFNGDKSLEETCRVIQSRASVYVGERVK